MVVLHQPVEGEEEDKAARAGDLAEDEQERTPTGELAEDAHWRAPPGLTHPTLSPEDTFGACGTACCLAALEGNYQKEKGTT